MREIKFRYILEIPADFMQKGDPVKTIVEYHTLEEIERGSTGFVNHVLVRVLSRDEWIGQKDKNGVEIYEGDILNSYDINDKKCTDIVSYTEGSYFYPLSSQVQWARFFNGYEPAEFEVIGNIYENPELLK